MTQKYIFLLNETKNGLLNLIITYENDIENANKINKIIQKITFFTRFKVGTRTEVLNPAIKLYNVWVSPK